jgi:hypothetical protein
MITTFGRDTITRDAITIDSKLVQHGIVHARQALGNGGNNQDQSHMSFIDRVRPSPLYTNLLKIQFGRDLASPSWGAGMQIQQSIRVLADSVIE